MDSYLTLYRMKLQTWSTCSQWVATLRLSHQFKGSREQRRQAKTQKSKSFKRTWISRARTTEYKLSTSSNAQQVSMEGPMGRRKTCLKWWWTWPTTTIRQTMCTFRSSQFSLKSSWWTQLTTTVSLLRKAQAEGAAWTQATWKPQHWQDEARRGLRSRVRRKAQTSSTSRWTTTQAVWVGLPATSTFRSCPFSIKAVRASSLWTRTTSHPGAMLRTIQSTPRKPATSRRAPPPTRREPPTSWFTTSWVWVRTPLKSSKVLVKLRKNNNKF